MFRTKKNLVRIPHEIVTELTEEKFLELCTHRDITKKAKYPLYLYLSDEKFVLSSIDVIKIIKGSSFKEIDVSHNRLQEIVGWDVFTRLKRLTARGNELQRVELNHHPNLMLLDLSFNQLTVMPNLNSLVNLRTLNLRNNYIGECNMSNISQCTRIEEINLSWNNIEWDTNTLNDTVFQLLPKFKKLQDINFANNPFSSNMVNYRALFISRLIKSLKIFDELIVTREEISEAQSSPPVQPLFASDIKAMMVGTSATKMKKVPSFSHIFKRSNAAVPSFEDFNAVLEETAPSYMATAAQKLAETLERQTKLGTRLENLGMSKFLTHVQSLMEKNVTSITKTFVISIFSSFTLLDRDGPEYDKLYTQCCRLGYWILQQYGRLATLALSELLTTIVSPSQANSLSQSNLTVDPQEQEEGILRFNMIHLVNIVDSIFEDVERRNASTNDSTATDDWENLDLLRQLSGKLFIRALYSFKDFTMDDESWMFSQLKTITPHEHRIVFLTILTDTARHYLKHDNFALAMRTELKEHHLHHKTITLLENSLCSEGNVGSETTPLLLRLVSACAPVLIDEFCTAGLHTKLLDHIIDHVDEGELQNTGDRATTEGLAAIMACFAHLCAHPMAQKDAQRENLLDVCIKTCINVTSNIVEQCKRSAKAKLASEDIIRLCACYETISILLQTIDKESGGDSSSVARLCLDVFAQFDNGRVLLEPFDRTSFGPIVANETKYGPTALFHCLRVIEFMMRLAKDHDEGQEKHQLYSSLSEITNDLQRLLLNIVKSSSTEDSRGSIEDTNYADMLRHESLIVFTLLPADSIQQPTINELCKVVIDTDTSVIIYSTSMHVDLAIQLLTVIVERTPQKNKAIESNAADFIDRMLQLIKAITSTANNLRHNRLLAEKTVTLLLQLHKRYGIVIHKGYQQYQELINTYTNIACQEEAIERASANYISQHKHLPLENTGIFNDVRLLMETLKRLTLGTNVFLRNMSVLADLLDCENEKKRNENHLEFIAQDGLGLLDSLVELINARHIHRPDTEQQQHQQQKHHRRNEENGFSTPTKRGSKSEHSKSSDIDRLTSIRNSSLSAEHKSGLTAPLAKIRAFGARTTSDIDTKMDNLMAEEVLEKEKDSANESSSAMEDPMLMALLQLKSELSNFSSDFWTRHSNQSTTAVSPYLSIRKLVTPELGDTGSELHELVFQSELQSKYTLVEDGKQSSRKDRQQRGSVIASSSPATGTSAVDATEYHPSSAAMDHEDTWSAISELSTNMEGEEEDEKEAKEKRSKQSGSEFKLVHRKSIYLNSEETGKGSTAQEQNQDSNDNVPTAMWSNYSTDTCFSSRDFFRLVFDDELEADGVYESMVSVRSAEGGEERNVSQMNSYSTWRSKRSKLFLLCGVVAVRIVLSLLKRSSYDVAKRMLDKHISPLSILSMAQQICETTQYSSFRINFLTLLVIQQLLVTYVDKGKIAGHAARKMKMARSELQVRTVYLSSVLLQQINRVIRRNVSLINSRMGTDSTSLGHLDLILSLHLSRAWHLVTSRLRLLEFFEDVSDLKQYRPSSASGATSMSIATDQLFRLNQYCQKIFIGIILPLPDLAILMRLLSVHAATQGQNVLLFSSRNLINDWGHVMGHLERAFEEVLSDRALLKYAVYYTSPIESHHLNKLDNDFYTYWSPSNELLQNVTEVVGEYMNVDSSSTHKIIDFLVRVESIADHPLRPSLFQSILNSVNVLHMRTALDRFLVSVLNSGSSTGSLLSPSSSRSMSVKGSGSRSARELSVSDGKEHIIVHEFGYHLANDGTANRRLLVAGSRHVYMFQENNNMIKLLACHKYSELTRVRVALGGKHIAIEAQPASAMRDGQSGILLFQFTRDGVAEQFANIIITHCNFTTSAVNHDMIDPVFQFMHKSIRSVLSQEAHGSIPFAKERICFYSRCVIVESASTRMEWNPGEERSLCVTWNHLAVLQENVARVFMALEKNGEGDVDTKDYLSVSEMRPLKDLKSVKIDETDPFLLLLSFVEDGESTSSATEPSSVFSIRLPSDSSVQFCLTLLTKNH